MKIKIGFEIVKAVDDYILVPVGDQMEPFNGTVILNETTVFLLDKLKKNQSIDNLVQFLVDEYDVDIETAQKDVNDLIIKMREAGIIDE